MSASREPLPSREPLASRGRTHLVAALLSATVLVIAGVVNLPFRYVEVGKHWVGVSQVEHNSTYSTERMPTMAGWPLRYWVRYDTDGLVQDRLWEPHKLWINLSFAALAAGMVYLFFWFRGRQLQTVPTDSFVVGTSNRLIVKVLDVAIALAILLIPAVILGQSHLVSQRHEAMVRQLARSGNCYVSCWLPEPIVQHIPRGLLRSFNRIRTVQLFRASSDKVAQAARIPDIIGLHCVGSEFDGALLEPLQSNVHFRSLELSERTLTREDAERISKLRYLAELKLIDADVDADLLPYFDRLSLRTVDLTNNPFKLSDLGKPGWSQSVLSLELTRPKQDVEDSIVIDGWPRLRSIGITRVSRLMNDATLTVRLANLPSLEIAALDRNQRHGLELENLPRLLTIEEGLGMLQRILRMDELVPGNMWLTDLKMSRTPSLKEFGCYAKDLDEFSIDDGGNLRSFALGSYMVSSIGSTHANQSVPHGVQKWIDQLGQRQGPGDLDLTGLPLADADLTPLVNNSRIRNLHFYSSSITFEQVQQLEGMDQLENLNIRDCQLEADDLAWLFERFPNLRTLDVNGAGLETIDLSTMSQLRRLTLNRPRHPKTVRMVGLPLLETVLSLQSAPDTLEIRDARSLVGLSVDGPWPKNAILSGLRDLEWFAGGGPEIDDELFEELLSCPQLDQLTLAYASVTGDRLKLIRRMKDLSILCLPGAELDDDITSEWSTLQSLWEINLDDTNVSVGTIAWLGGVESLRRVSLNRVPLSDDAAEALALLPQISELQLAGASVDPKFLVPLAQAGNIESLDLSGWEPSEALLSVLRGIPSLKLVKMHDTNITEEQVQSLMRVNPTIYLDAGKAADRFDSETSNELRRRAVALARWSNSGWRQALRERAGIFSNFRLSDQQGTQVSADLWMQDSNRIRLGQFRAASTDK